MLCARLPEVCVAHAHAFDRAVVLAPLIAPILSTLVCQPTSSIVHDNGANGSACLSATRSVAKTRSTTLRRWAITEQNRLATQRDATHAAEVDEAPNSSFD